MKETIINLGECSTLVRCSGSSHAPAVILLHSLGLDRCEFDALRSHLGENWRLIAFDQRGHGAATASPSQVSLPSMVNDVMAVQNALNIERVHLVGHSMGGAIAGLAAVAGAERVASVSLIAVPLKGISAFLERAEAAERGALEEQIQQTLTRWFVDPHAADCAAQVAYARRCLESMPVSMWAAAWRALSTFVGFTEIGAALPPTLCIAPELDPSTPPAMMAQVAAMAPSGTERHVIAGASHMATLEKPAAVAAMLAQHWQSNS